MSTKGPSARRCRKSGEVKVALRRRYLGLNLPLKLIAEVAARIWCLNSEENFKQLILATNGWIVNLVLSKNICLLTRMDHPFLKGDTVYCLGQVGLFLKPKMT